MRKYLVLVLGILLVVGSVQAVEPLLRNNSEDMHVYTGTSSPGTATPRLDVASGYGIGINRERSSLALEVSAYGSDGVLIDGDGSGDAQLKIMNDFGGNHFLFSDNDQGNALTLESENAMSFNTNGNNERMTIDSSGDVGIGTASPSDLLTVAGKSTFTDRIRVQKSNPKITLKDAANTWSSGSANAWIEFRDSDGNRSAWVGPASSGDGHMYITSELSNKQIRFRNDGLTMAVGEDTANMSGNRIKDVQDPADPQDAATKSYADNTSKTAGQGLRSTPGEIHVGAGEGIGTTADETYVNWGEAGDLNSSGHLFTDFMIKEDTVNGDTFADGWSVDCPTDYRAVGCSHKCTNGKHDTNSWPVDSNTCKGHEANDGDHDGDCTIYAHCLAIGPTLIAELNDITANDENVDVTGSNTGTGTGDFTFEVTMTYQDLWPLNGGCTYEETQTRTVTIGSGVYTTETFSFTPANNVNPAGEECDSASTVYVDMTSESGDTDTCTGYPDGSDNC